MFGSHGPKKGGQGKTRYRVKLDLGKSLLGWLVGPIVGLDTHYLNTTRPCRRDVTKGRMGCYCGKMQLESVWKGYVPLIDRDGVHCFVQICETYSELAFKCPIFAAVKVTRLTHRGAPYAVKADAWTDIDPKSYFDIKRPVDIRPWLLKLWGDDELTEWLNAHPENTDPLSVSDLDESMGAAVVREVKGIVHERARGKLPESVGDVLKSVPGANGKGHK